MFYAGSYILSEDHNSKKTFFFGLYNTNGRSVVLCARKEFSKISTFSFTSHTERKNMS